MLCRLFDRCFLDLLGECDLIKEDKDLMYVDRRCVALHTRSNQKDTNTAVTHF